MWVVLLVGRCVAAVVLDTVRLESDPILPYYYFGRSVAVNSTVVVVGAVGSMEATLSPSAFVFETQDSGASFSLVETLIGSDTGAGDEFGASVAVGGNLVVVGAPAIGAAYVFEASDGSFWQAAKLEGTNSFGAAVAVDGSLVCVGAPSNASGAAYLYLYEGSGLYTLTSALAPSSASAYFGLSVDVSGSLVVVGGANASVGAAYAFATTSEGVASDSTTILAANASSVAVDGTRVVVGSAINGAAYVFEKNDDLSFTQTQTLTGGSEFGAAVGISGDLIIVGAYAADKTGLSYAFRNGSQYALLSGTETLGARFGISVAIDDDLAVVGADADGLASVPDIEGDFGSAYTFTLATPTAAPSLGPSSTAPTATCPDNYTASPVSQRCYIEASSSLYWTACKTECESRGDIMFCPRSIEENDFAFEEFTALSGYNEDDVDFRYFNVRNYGAFWIGYYESSGTFEWVQGCDSNFTNWDTGKPVSSADYEYAHVYFDGTWVNYPDYYDVKCICETAAVVPSSMPTELPSGVPSTNPTNTPSSPFPTLLPTAFARAYRRANEPADNVSVGVSNIRTHSNAFRRAVEPADNVSVGVSNIRTYNTAFRRAVEPADELSICVSNLRTYSTAFRRAVEPADELSICVSNLRTYSTAFRRAVEPAVTRANRIAVGDANERA
ncbi:hypothetical protein CTAYLR_004335 [Chrysophaeum taylorii]|uniref:C-type lectin domain-containing protein n=1 Tax=Chrysophaeum taylorii TaxID=2483200 RepID=A0AAD7UI95_9STRA|nr:hypothetical protein CTAYLR_004335 [Chrysophaeum taylorii]